MTDTVIFITASQVAGISIPSTQTSLTTTGFSTPGDKGAAMYRRVSTQPVHYGRLQSADGGWWEITEYAVSPEMFGAVGDGAANDAAAITLWVDYLNRKGGTGIARGNYNVAGATGISSNSVYVSMYFYNDNITLDLYGSTFNFPATTGQYGTNYRPIFVNGGGRLSITNSVTVPTSAYNRCIDKSGYQIGSPISKGDTSIILASDSSKLIYTDYTNFSPGDIAFIRSGQLLSSSTTEPNSELMIVRSSNPNDIWSLTCSGTSGSFQLQITSPNIGSPYSGITSSIAYNSTASAVQSIIQATIQTFFNSTTNGWTMSSTATGGTYTLTITEPSGIGTPFSGTTTALAYNADAPTVQAAILAVISTFYNGSTANVTCSGLVSSGMSIVLGGSLAGLALNIAVTPSLTGGTATITSGASVVCSGSLSTGMTLTFGGSLLGLALTSISIASGSTVTGGTTTVSRTTVGGVSFTTPVSGTYIQEYFITGTGGLSGPTPTANPARYDLTNVSDRIMKNFKLRGGRFICGAGVLQAVSLWGAIDAEISDAYFAYPYNGIGSRDARSALIDVQTDHDGTVNNAYAVGPSTGCSDWDIYLNHRSKGFNYLHLHEKTKRIRCHKPRLLNAGATGSSLAGGIDLNAGCVDAFIDEPFIDTGTTETSAIFIGNTCNDGVVVINPIIRNAAQVTSAIINYGSNVDLFGERYIGQNAKTSSLSYTDSNGNKQNSGLISNSRTYHFSVTSNYKSCTIPACYSQYDHSIMIVYDVIEAFNDGSNNTISLGYTGGTSNLLNNLSVSATGPGKVLAGDSAAGSELGRSLQATVSATRDLTLNFNGTGATAGKVAVTLIISKSRRIN